MRTVYASYFQYDFGSQIAQTGNLGYYIYLENYVTKVYAYFPLNFVDTLNDKYDPKFHFHIDVVRIDCCCINSVPQWTC